MADERTETRLLEKRLFSNPTPQFLFNEVVNKHMMEFGTIVIAAGGGGIPAYIKEDKGLRLVDGVIDKDMTSALLRANSKIRRIFYYYRC